MMHVMLAIRLLVVSLIERSRNPSFVGWVGVMAFSFIFTFSEPVAAHAGALRLTQEPVSVPRWLVVSTGGGVVGGSFLITSLLTDHETIRSINEWHRSAPAGEMIRSVGIHVVRLLSVVVLGVIVLSGLFGPQTPTSNFAILVVWAGWWAGYTISVYLIGNTWPAVNPWRALVSLVSRFRFGSRFSMTYPRRLGVWPSVVGLLGLVWLEVISPIAQSPSVLVLVIVGYSLITLVGATVYGENVWFSRVDPISQVFRWYGRVAPFQRTETGIDLTLPSAALASETYQRGTVFIIALLWATTYDGFISTPVWNTIARTVVGWGVPALVLYAGTMIAGFVVFLVVYRTAARLSRRTGRTYVAPHVIEERFVLSLLPIAAGYHLAHYLGYFLSLTPALAAVLIHPFGGAVNPKVLVLPDWFGQLQLLFVLGGHLFAVWVAHATAFELFAGRLQPIRSQYPLIAVMILYTVTSMWIVIQPYTSPPFV